MSLLSTLPPLLATMVQASATRAFYGRRQRPWLPGYRAKAVSPGAAVLAGVNAPGFLSTRRIKRISDGTTITWTLTADEQAAVGALPTTADAALTALLYLQAILQTYPEKERQNATIRYRKGSDVAPTVLNEWRVVDATNFAIGAAAPVGTVIELVVPVTVANATTGENPPALLTAAGTMVAGVPELVTLTDYMSVTAATVEVNRLFR